MKRAFLAGVVALAAVNTAAQAADLARRQAMPTKAPAYVEPYYNWTGFYLGVNGGGAFGQSSLSNVLGSSGDFDVNGGLVGGTIGYNWQVGHVVFGVEGDIDWASIKGTTTSLVCPSVSCETHNSWLGTARGRIGYAFNRVLPYITAGGAFGDVKMTPAGLAGETDTQAGWTAGGGVEVGLRGPWSIKVEYLYADLGSMNCSAVNCGISTDTDFRTSIVRGGINYRF
jgi:outer membrane immunogenic protein